MKDFSKIQEIYHDALQHPAAERDAFLRDACGDDAWLLGEIESLLSFDEQAEDFIETPPVDLAASFFKAPVSTNLFRLEIKPLSGAFSARRGRNGRKFIWLRIRN